MTVSVPRASVAADAAMTAGILLLGAAMLIAGGGIVARWQRSAVFPGSARASEDFLHTLGAADLLGALAAATGSAVVAWWLLSLVCSAAAVTMERRGNRRGAAAARRFSPAFMRRLILAALSLQLLSGPAAHASAAPGPEWMPTRTEASAPASPGASRAESTSATVEPGWQPSAPVTDPGLLAPPSVRAGVQADKAPGQVSGEVTVLAGDTLWDIAKKDLGPGASDVEVALHWPRWYQANRALIGLSPDVLLPGQVLHAPQGR